MQRNTGLSFFFHPTLFYTCDLPPKISLEGRSGFVGAEKLSPEDNKDLILSHSDLDMERTQVSQLSPTFHAFHPVLSIPAKWLCTKAHGKCYTLYSLNPAFKFGPGW